MLTEDKIVKNSDDVILVMWIVVVEEFKNLKFHSSLVLKFLFISNDLQSNKITSLMIQALDSLAKTTRAKCIKHFVSIAEMILHNCLIISLIIIISIVVNIHQFESLNLPFTWYLYRSFPEIARSSLANGS